MAFWDDHPTDADLAAALEKERATTSHLLTSKADVTWTEQRCTELEKKSAERHKELQEVHIGIQQQIHDFRTTLGAHLTNLEQLLRDGVPSELKRICEEHMGAIEAKVREIEVFSAAATKSTAELQAVAVEIGRLNRGCHEALAVVEKKVIDLRSELAAGERRLAEQLALGLTINNEIKVAENRLQASVRESTGELASAKSQLQDTYARQRQFKSLAGRLRWLFLG